MKFTSDQNSLVTNSIQNTFFYVVLKKVSNSGLKQHEGEKIMIEYIYLYLVNYYFLLLFLLN